MYVDRMLVCSRIQFLFLHLFTRDVVMALRHVVEIIIVLMFLMSGIVLFSAGLYYGFSTRTSELRTVKSFMMRTFERRCYGLGFLCIVLFLVTGVMFGLGEVLTTTVGLLWSWVASWI